MSAIFGQCPLCPKKERKQRLFGGYCAYHLKNNPSGKKKAELKNLIKKPGKYL